LLSCRAADVRPRSCDIADDHGASANHDIVGNSNAGLHSAADSDKRPSADAHIAA
jgi:hypothetical protein